MALLRTVHARDAFARILGESRDSYGFALVGYVVMPEHVHLLIGESGRGTPSDVLQVLKQRVSRRLRLDFGNDLDRLPRFWQRRFYDFNVWSLKKRVEKLEYMHMNPVRRGLVGHPKDWAWSSFLFYSKQAQGMIRVDPVR
jgi:putative transposase